MSLKTPQTPGQRLDVSFNTDPLFVRAGQNGVTVPRGLSAVESDTAVPVLKFKSDDAYATASELTRRASAAKEMRAALAAQISAKRMVTSKAVNADDYYEVCFSLPHSYADGALCAALNTRLTVLSSIPFTLRCRRRTWKHPALSMSKTLHTPPLALPLLLPSSRTMTAAWPAIAAAPPPPDTLSRPERCGSLCRRLHLAALPLKATSAARRSRPGAQRRRERSRAPLTPRCALRCCCSPAWTRLRSQVPMRMAPRPLCSQERAAHPHWCARLPASRFRGFAAAVDT